jgi:hypothetical protein
VSNNTDSHKAIFRMERVIDAWVDKTADENTKIKIAKQWLEWAGKRCVRNFDLAKDGGVLFVKSRKVSSATVSIKGIDSKGNFKREDALSRAMFNSRTLNVYPPAGSISEHHEHEMIAYEAPLLRPPTKRLAGLPRCDVVAVTSDPFRITAVEVKVDEKNSTSTNLDYGLVESWLYGYLLALRAYKKLGNLILEIDHCRKYYLKESSGAFSIDASDLEIRFALAAPDYYFCTQLDKFGLRPITDLLAKLNDIKSPISRKHKFDGFWVLPSHDRGDKLNSIVTSGQKDERQDRITPMLRSTDVLLCRDVDSLCKLVKCNQS